MIDLIKQDGLPVSIVVPTTSKRIGFFNAFVKPMLMAQGFKEIIVVKDEGSAPVQRNIGLEKAKQPYIMFVDDDTVLPVNYVETLYDTLKMYDVDVVYTGYLGIVLNKNVQPSTNFKIPAIDFNYERLREGNFIDTTSLIKKEVCPAWDESLKRYQDWDLYLTMAEKNAYFTCVKNTYFIKYFMYEGITSKNNNIMEAYKIIKQKHGR